MRQVAFPTSREEARKLFAAAEPLLLTGPGAAPPRFEPAQWSPSALLAHAESSPEHAQRLVSVHVAAFESAGRMSFTDKATFKFETMPFAQLLERLVAQDQQERQEQQARQQQAQQLQQEPATERLYLRAIGANARKDRAHFWRDWPELASKMPFPDALCDKEAYHSSVLRLSSPQLQLWTHYDVLHNVLFQLHGTKRVVLFRPDHAAALDLRGSSSSIVRIEPEDVAKLDPDCPFARARREALELELCPGQALFIPALWAHNVLALPEQGPGVAVNVFWKHLADVHYGAKDLYGNRDPLLAEEAMALALRARDVLRSAKDDGSTLPDDFVTFYSAYMAALITD